MRNLAGTGISGHFFHEVPILTAPLVSGGVLEVEVLLDVVGSELNTGLFVGNRALRADTNRVPTLTNDLVNISGIILTGVVGLKDSGSDSVVDQALAHSGFVTSAGESSKTTSTIYTALPYIIATGIEVESEPLSAVSPTAMMVSGSRSFGSSKK